MTVYAIQWSNYDPPEIDSLWTTRERAQERCDELNKESAPYSTWCVEPMEVLE